MYIDCVVMMMDKGVQCYCVVLYLLTFTVVFNYYSDYYSDNGV